jgi:putative transposase
VLGLSTSGHYAWLKREPSERAMRDEELKERIGTIHEENRRVHGRPRIHAELLERGERVGGKRVGRLMGELGIRGVSRRRRKPGTTNRDRDAWPAPDLVDRDFTAGGPDELWVADITYIPTWAGFLYLAVVVDARSRRVVGWSMATHFRTELVLDAMNMAIRQRRPEQVIHHSDQGTQYTSVAFGLRCKEVGVRPSMGSVGDAHDNAFCESFFATLECELLDRQRFRTQAEARMAACDFIEGFRPTAPIHPSDPPPGLRDRHGPPPCGAPGPPRSPPRRIPHPGGPLSLYPMTASGAGSFEASR